MTDKTDCDMKCSSFIGYVNKLKANFGYLQPFVLGNLFYTFCCSFYGSPLLEFSLLPLSCSTHEEKHRGRSVQGQYLNSPC